jgi:4-diphosphocytidyl-2-C-methyl-D-erythritol kinase
VSVPAALGTLTLQAPAKVNLDLRVVGRRPDGNHLLESTFVLLELGDDVVLDPRGAGLEVDGPATEGVPPDATNLAWRGLQAAVGPDPGCGLRLHKRIPSAAGLGGGSSDAAAAWRLGRAWAGSVDVAGDDDLEDLARIGADVPFFAAGVPAARVSGIGERVVPVEPLPLVLVLIHADLRVRTADVFAELREAEWGSGANDLLAAATRVCPEIGDLFALMTAAGGEPRLAGSGPTVFAVVADEERAARIADRVRRGGVAATVTRARLDAASITPMDVSG